MSSEQRTPCALCGRRWEKANEHVVGQWMSREVAAMLDPGPDGSHFTTRGPTGKVKRGKTISLGTRKVCKVWCNEGWLKALEDDVIPTVKPMLRGENVTLTQREKERLALWAMGRSIVWDLSSEHVKERPLYSPEDRRWFERFRRPFDHTQIWLAAYQYSDFPEDAWVHRTTPLTDGDDGPDGPEIGTGSAPRFGIIWFRIFRLYGPPPIRMPLDHNLIPIWPDTSGLDTWPGVVFDRHTEGVFLGTVKGPPPPSARRVVHSRDL